MIIGPSGKLKSILEELLKGRVLETMGIIREFDTTNPSGQISHLKTKWKVPISPKIIESVDKQGNPTRYAQYQIPPSELKGQRERFGYKG